MRRRKKHAKKEKTGSVKRRRCRLERLRDNASMRNRKGYKGNLKLSVDRKMLIVRGKWKNKRLRKKEKDINSNKNLRLLNQLNLNSNKLHKAIKVRKMKKGVTLAEVAVVLY